VRRGAVSREERKPSLSLSRMLKEVGGGPISPQTPTRARCCWPFSTLEMPSPEGSTRQSDGESRQAAHTLLHERQHTSAYASIRQHTSAYVSQHTAQTLLSASNERGFCAAAAYVSIRQHTSAYVSIRRRRSCRHRTSEASVLLLPVGWRLRDARSSARPIASPGAHLHERQHTSAHASIRQHTSA
jgi:hypothetical protein